MGPYGGATSHSGGGAAAYPNRSGGSASNLNYPGAAGATAANRNNPSTLNNPAAAGAAAGNRNNQSTLNNPAAAGAAAANRSNQPSLNNPAAAGAAAANRSNQPTLNNPAAAGAAAANRYDANNSYLNHPAAVGAYAGANAANNRYGTYYAGDAALAAQRNTVVAGTAGYPNYNAGMYAGYPNAWPATNMTNPSLYANPGYGAVAGQTGMAPQPAPYDYGGNVVTQPNAVYVNGDNVGTPQQYASQASQIAATGNAPPDPNAQWQPLGVYAMAEGGQSSPSAVIQLAVNARGALRGNFHNTADNSIAPIAGAVDPKTQRAAWTVGGQQSPVFEAGIANLTQDQTTMLVHTADGQPQQLNLFRLQDPSAAGGPGNAPGPAPQ
jgi:hypothetical protein